jgi:hypothetical protein
LEKTGERVLVKRAEFIRRQCNNDNAADLLDDFREEWGIPYFEDEVVTADDFKNWFLHKFRDHWLSDDFSQEAKLWFLSSFEARFVHVYELWSPDEGGDDELAETTTGNYKSILWSLAEGGAYEMLMSPVFTTEDLDRFIGIAKQQRDDFDRDLEDIKDYIRMNPNCPDTMRKRDM